MIQNNDPNPKLGQVHSAFCREHCTCRLHWVVRTAPRSRAHAEGLRVRSRVGRLVALCAPAALLTWPSRDTDPPCPALGQVATPKQGRDPPPPPPESKPCRDIISHVATPFEPTVGSPVVTPNPCRDIPVTPLCRNTKPDCLTTSVTKGVSRPQLA